MGISPEEYRAIYGADPPATPPPAATASPAPAVPPQNTSQPGQPATPAELRSIYGGPPVTASTPPADGPGFMSRMWSGILNIPSEILHPTPATKENVPGYSETGHDFATGFARGGADVLTDPAVLALRAGGATGLVSSDTVDAAKANADKLRKDFERDYGHSTAASLGRVAGQTAVTAPLLGVGGRAAVAGAEMLPTAGNIAVRAPGAVARFATGATQQSGFVPRALQLATEGAVTGAESGALTSGKSDASLGSQVVEGGLTGAATGVAAGGLAKAIDTLRGYTAGLSPAIIDAAVAGKTAGVNVPLYRYSDNPILKGVSYLSSKTGAEKTAQKGVNDFIEGMDILPGGNAYRTASGMPIPTGEVRGAVTDKVIPGSIDAASNVLKGLDKFANVPPAELPGWAKTALSMAGLGGGGAALLYNPSTWPILAGAYGLGKGAKFLASRPSSSANLLETALGAPVPSPGRVLPYAVPPVVGLEGEGQRQPVDMWRGSRLRPAD